MNTEDPSARSRRRHRRAVTAMLTLPLFTIAACGTTGGSAAPGDTGRPSRSPAGTAASGGASATPAPSAPSTTAAPDTTHPAPSTTGGTGTASKQVRTGVYFLHGEKVSPAPRTVTAPATATAAVRTLLTGPSRYESAHSRTTAIPSGTTLRSVVVRDHVATVDLSGR